MTAAERRAAFRQMPRIDGRCWLLVMTRSGPQPELCWRCPLSARQSYYAPILILESRQ